MMTDAFLRPQAASASETRSAYHRDVCAALTEYIARGGDYRLCSEQDEGGRLRVTFDLGDPEEYQALLNDWLRQHHPGETDSIE